MSGERRRWGTVGSRVEIGVWGGRTRKKRENES